MNNTTRSIIFFAGLFAMILYYFAIMPLLPMAMTNEVFYINYLAAMVIIVFPWIECLMRKLVLKKYKLSTDDILFSMKIKDIGSVQFITYIILAFLVILLPITTNQFNFSNLKPLHWTIFVIWVLVSAIWIRLTYSSTKAHFNEKYLLITGIDLRLDFPFGNNLYSHSGVYFYDDFKHFYIEGQVVYMVLENDKGRIAFHINNNVESQVIGFLGAQKIKYLK